MNSIFTFWLQILDISKILAPPLKSAVCTIIPVNSLRSSSYSPKNLKYFQPNKETPSWPDSFERASKSFNKSKWTFMSVNIILLINCLLKVTASSLFRLDRKLQSFSWSINMAVAAWCCSRGFQLKNHYTLLSWYLVASLDLLLISNKFVRPVWLTSWQRADTIVENLVISFKYFFDFLQRVKKWALCITAIPWS